MSNEAMNMDSELRKENICRGFALYIHEVDTQDEHRLQSINNMCAAFRPKTNLSRCFVYATSSFTSIYPNLLNSRWLKRLADSLSSQRVKSIWLWRASAGASLQDLVVWSMYCSWGCRVCLFRFCQWCSTIASGSGPTKTGVGSRCWERAIRWAGFRWL